MLIVALPCLLAVRTLPARPATDVQLSDEIPKIAGYYKICIVVPALYTPYASKASLVGWRICIRCVLTTSCFDLADACKIAG